MILNFSVLVCFLKDCSNPTKFLLLFLFPQTYLAVLQSHLFVHFLEGESQLLEFLRILILPLAFDSEDGLKQEQPGPVLMEHEGCVQSHFEEIEGVVAPGHAQKLVVEGSHLAEEFALVMHFPRHFAGIAFVLAPDRPDSPLLLQFQVLFEDPQVFPNKVFYVIPIVGAQQRAFLALD